MPAGDRDASVVGLTQTGVTQRLRALESQLGATLFTRSRRGMRLTAEGEALLRYCQAARDLEGATLARITGGGRETEARVRITGPTSLLRSRVVPACAPVLREFPSLLLTFDVCDLEDRADELRSGRAQLAVLPPEQVAREMDSRLLRPERYVLVACPAWKKRKLRDVIQSERIIDFDETDRMTFSYLRKFGLLGLARKERHFVNNNEAIVELFGAGAGYGVLTQEVARPHVESGALAVLNAGAVLENALALAWYPRPESPAYWRALLSAIR